MKVDGNDPVISTAPRYCSESDTDHSMYGDTTSNIPIRLEIASRVLAGLVTTQRSQATNFVNLALSYADSLIKAHNDSFKDGLK